jgi:asparagine synthase (glutamine-hydrolysing)
VSGFLLCWHRAGGSLDPAVLARVRARLRARGPEGERTVEAPRAVAVHAAFTDAVGAADGLPILADEWLVAGDLRLDDRAHLRARLRDAGVEPPPERGDAWLLHAALRAWGADAASRLIGDFAFAALDLRRGALVAARGTFGVKPLFVAETAAFVAVSNEIDALLALPGVDGSPDERALVDFLRAGSIVAPDRTARRGVTRVPPSHQRRWETDRAHAVERHWRFPVPTARVGLRDEEVLEGFREVLGAAVRDRLRTPRSRSS